MIVIFAGQTQPIVAASTKSTGITVPESVLAVEGLALATVRVITLRTHALAVMFPVSMRTSADRFEGMGLKSRLKEVRIVVVDGLVELPLGTGFLGDIIR